MKHTKTMYDLLARACRIAHPKCVTDLEALEAELIIVQSFKSLKEAHNICVKSEIEMIAILETVIESLKNVECRIENVELTIKTGVSNG